MTQFRIASKAGRTTLAALALLGSLALAANAQAADRASKAAGDKGRAVILQSVLDCRAITDPTQRLACFDGAVGQMDQAEKSGDIVVIDRAQVREAKKAAFGFEMPHFTFFDKGDKPEVVDKVSGVAESAYVNKDGKWVVVLEDGGKWVQVDNEPISVSPRKGSKVEIRTAVFGSYFMTVDGQRSVRAHRVN
ncbi:MAG: hypothetical protein JWP35_2550 [Caulobacter sp.]|nr:hypothetical protein [Caulobacter sp.]